MQVKQKYRFQKTSKSHIRVVINYYAPTNAIPTMLTQSGWHFSDNFVYNRAASLHLTL